MTFYFPPLGSAVMLYEIGFVPGRDWKTLSVPGPTGREQVRALYFKPKRTIANMTIVNGDTVFGSTQTALDRASQLRSTLNLLAGRFNWFYIFNPVARSFIDFYLGTLTITGGVAQGLPRVIPFKGGSTPASGVYVLGPTKIGTATLDDNGPGGEKRITAIAWVGGAPGDGTYAFYIAMNGTYERIPVRFTSDHEGWPIEDTSAAGPEKFTFGIEEYFG